MQFATRGDRQSPAILFFHAMGVTGASSEPVARYLQQNYYCILPTSSVYCAGQKYSSKADELRQIEDFLHGQRIDRLALVVASSIGQPWRRHFWRRPRCRWCRAKKSKISKRRLILVLLVLFAVWPNKRRDALRAPFVGHNCAHRGYFGKDQRPPENSLPAFAAAAQNGYGIELDVQFTSDRRLVVFHDDTLDRMTPAKGFVHDMDWTDFSAQPLAGSNEHPPLFADMLRTVAETNPDTPLIVEIKSRAEYSKTYLEELCRATIAELKAYPGPYCIESFDPRVVGIVRRQAPDILRGQLADSYQSYRKDGTHAVPAFAFSHLFGNFLGRPDFIAWCPAKRNWAVKLNAALGAMMVMWTALPEHDTAKLEAENDAVIFQWYAPKQKYRE